MENYQKYNGLAGTSLKSGCGVYIRTGTKYKDRKDNYHKRIKHYHLYKLSSPKKNFKQFIQLMVAKYPRQNFQGAQNRHIPW